MSRSALPVNVVGTDLATRSTVPRRPSRRSTSPGSCSVREMRALVSELRGHPVSRWWSWLRRQVGPAAQACRGRSHQCRRPASVTLLDASAGTCFVRVLFILYGPRAPRHYVESP